MRITETSSELRAGFTGWIGSTTPVVLLFGMFGGAVAIGGNYGTTPAVFAIISALVLVQILIVVELHRAATRRRFSALRQATAAPAEQSRRKSRGAVPRPMTIFAGR